MKKILKELRPFKIPLILIGVFGFLYFIVAFIVPTVQRMQANKTPIVSIRGSNNEKYTQGMEIRKGDFHIIATHEDGKETELYTEEFKISKKMPDQTGEITKVHISLIEQPSITTVVNVQNEREKVTEISCGNPEIDAVKAVLYSNGELRFEGNGDVLQYDKGSFPWQNISEQKITAVTFESTVAPVSMDYWFQSLSDLTYVGPLPESVESIVGMCSGCTTLEEAPEWEQCTRLLDISSAYEDCTSMKKIPAIPSSVRNASYMCRGCIEIQNAPDMRNAKNLLNTTGMYENCKKMTTTTSAPAVEIMDSMYASCINLKKMPEIPDSTKSMSRTFENNLSMVEVTSIPKGVTDVSSCFDNCPKISGSLVVDANPTVYGGFLVNTCNATSLDLTGSSKLLNELALTHTNYNITVNGEKPVEPK